MEINELLNHEFWGASWWSVAQWQAYTFNRVYFLYGIAAIPLLYLLRYGLYNRHRLRLAFSYSSKEIPSSPTALLRFVPPILQSMAIACMLIALARPQVSTSSTEIVAEGIEIVLALDVSESMLLEDFKPNRLESAKKTAISFVNGRKYDRIGLVVFAKDAIALAPLTADYGLLKTYIKDINPEMISQGGTAIGTAIGVATNRLRNSKTTSRIIVLLSDGNNTAGNIDPAIAAKLAQAFGIKMYSILVGKEGKVPFGMDDNGEPQYLENAIDETTLKEIARLGNGKYFRAADEQSLVQVFKQIDILERSAVKTLNYSEAIDVYPIFIAWAITFLVAWMATKASFVSNMLED